MRHCLLIAILLAPASLWSACANTAYGGGFTCVQSPAPIANSSIVSTTTIALSFAANTTAGNGVAIVGTLCTSNPCANNGTPPNVTVTDNINDTGFQPCANNGSISYVRYWYCWWLPSVGVARTFTMHTGTSYAATLWIAEFSGACNTAACIGTDVPAVYCMGPCGAQITTVFTNVLVVGGGFSSGNTLTAAAGWNLIIGNAAGSGIASFQAVPGPYTPAWTNTVMLQALSMSIKSRTNSISTQITVPAMPVY